MPESRMYAPLATNRRNHDMDRLWFDAAIRDERGAWSKGWLTQSTALRFGVLF